MQDVTTDSFDSLVNGQVCILDFVAPWCQPCSVLTPILKEVEEETGVPVMKIDVDDSPQLAERFRISNLPSIIVWADGQPKKKIVGLKSKRDILQALSEATATTV